MHHVQEALIRLDGGKAFILGGAARYNSFSYFDADWVVEGLVLGERLTLLILINYGHEMRAGFLEGTTCWLVLTSVDLRM